MIDNKFTQVVEFLENDTIRVYNIIEEDSRIGDNDDPLTTIVVRGYEDTKA